MKKKSRPRAAREFFWATYVSSNSVAFALKYTRSSPTNTSRIKARIQAQCLGHPMWLCARECPLRRPRTRRSLCRRPFRCNPLRRRPFRRRLPCCRLCRLCRRLAPCLCIHPRPGSRRPPLLARLGSRLGSALGSARLGSIGLVGTAWHGSARLGTAQHGSARLEQPRLHACRQCRPGRLCSAQPSSAQLSSAHLPSREVRAARLDRHGSHGSGLRASRLAAVLSSSPPPACAAQARRGAAAL